MDKEEEAIKYLRDNGVILVYPIKVTSSEFYDIVIQDSIDMNHYFKVIDGRLVYDFYSYPSRYLNDN